MAASPIESVDVVVVGAGVSGLSAAYKLLKKDPSLRVAVLEAKGRVGGRTWSAELKTGRGSDVFDFGGQWVGSCQTHVTRLIAELGLLTYPQYSQGKTLILHRDNKPVTYSGDIPALPWFCLLDLHLLMKRIAAMQREINVEDPGSSPHADEWDSITLHEALKRWAWYQRVRETVEIACRTIFGSEPRDMSLLYFLTYCKAAGGLEPIITDTVGFGGQESKVQGGAFGISRALVNNIGEKNVHLNSPVASITQDEEAGVTVTTTDGRVFSCDRAILALPPHQAATIHYQPPLPADKMHVLRRMPVGNLIKIIVTYKTAFWREAGLSGEAVTDGGPSVTSHCDRGPLSLVYDNTTHSGHPALVAFIGGRQHLLYSSIKAVDRQRAVLHTLSLLFGRDAEDYVEYREVDWSGVEYSGGCPVSVATPGVMSLITPGLRLPTHRLHFAGTESATVWCGFINGAVQSGYRAASEVLYHLRPQSFSPDDLTQAPNVSPSRRSTRDRARTKWAVRWTVGLAVTCIMLVVAKKSFFRKAM